ncbi:MAG: B12-binding domain-containing protein [Desulfatibacillaceae bacterium]
MISKELYDDYLNALLAGDRGVCLSHVQSLLDRDEAVGVIYKDLIHRSMYEVGALWERNRIPVSVEHMATAITESLLPLVYPRVFSTPRIGKKAVVSCIANEYHQLGAKIVADSLELLGWDAYFLGANTPARDLLSLIEVKQPDLLGLSVAVYFSVPNLVRAVETVRDAFPELPVFVGGQAFRWGGLESVAGFRDVTHVEGLDQLEDAVEQRFGQLSEGTLWT